MFTVGNGGYEIAIYGLRFCSASEIHGPKGPGSLVHKGQQMFRLFGRIGMRIFVLLDFVYVAKISTHYFMSKCF